MCFSNIGLMNSFFDSRAYENEQSGGNMYNKEIYEKNIIEGLSRLQYELNSHNAANLYDIDITSEDFFCRIPKLDIWM